MTEDRARLHTAVLVAPSKERRKLRKQRRKAEARLHVEQRSTALAAAKAKAEEERAERRATLYLPKSGEPGAVRLRTPGRFHLTRHQGTSATLAGAYPFVAEGGLGTDGVFVGHALRRLVAGDLAGLFDGPSTVTFDPSLPMISLYLSRVTENSTLISVLMTCSSAWMESALLDPNGGQRWVIYDEAWRLMSHPALLRRMDAHWRLARHYGIANMLIFHKLTDLDNVGDQGSAMRSLANSLLANAETRIVYRQESDQIGPTATALGLTGTEQQLLPNLGVGQGLWRIKARSFVCQHQLHPDELALFDTNSRAAGSHR